MKQLTKSLFVLMLMLGTMLEMKAADVYLLTAQTINGSVGKYEVPSNHQLAQNSLSAGESGGTVAQSAQMSNRVTISWAISSRHIIKVENIIQAATARR